MRRDVFAASELASIRRAADALIDWASRARGRTYWLDGHRFVDVEHCTVQYEHRPGSREVRVIEPVHAYSEALDALVDDVRLARPIGGLVGSRRLALWTDKLNVKGAGGSGFGWHQDSPYWQHDHPDVDRLPNVMLAIDAADQNNGCLRLVPGSHRAGVLPGCRDGSQLGGFFTDPERFDAEASQPVALSAGWLAFFSPHIVHGSSPNHSRVGRRALILTYQPADRPALKTRRVRNVAPRGTGLPMSAAGLPTGRPRSWRHLDRPNRRPPRRLPLRCPASGRRPG